MHGRAPRSKEVDSARKALHLWRTDFRPSRIGLAPRLTAVLCFESRRRLARDEPLPVRAPAVVAQPGPIPSAQRLLVCGRRIDAIAIRRRSAFFGLGIDADRPARHGLAHGRRRRHAHQPRAPPCVSQLCRPKRIPGPMDAPQPALDPRSVSSCGAERADGTTNSQEEQRMDQCRARREKGRWVSAPATGEVVLMIGSRSSSCTLRALAVPAEADAARRARRLASAVKLRPGMA